MTALDIALGIDTKLHMTDVIDKLKIVRTFQAKLMGYSLDLIIPIQLEDGETDHVSAAQISGRTRRILNEQLISREYYLTREIGILTSIQTYLSTTPTVDKYHVEDLFEELRECAGNVLPISDVLSGPLMVSLLFSRLKIRHIIEQGDIVDDLFYNKADFSMFDRRSTVSALLKSGGLDVILKGYKSRLTSYDLSTLSSSGRRMNHYLIRMLTEMTEIRRGGGSYIEMADKDITRDDTSRILKLIQQMEEDTPVGGDELIFGLFSDCYLQGFNLFK